MACPPSNVKFQLRRATSASWNSTNPILQPGEPGIEIDNYRIKVGDGVNHWGNLPYVNSSVVGPTGPSGSIGPTGNSGTILNFLGTDWVNGADYNVNDVVFGSDRNAYACVSAAGSGATDPIIKLFGQDRKWVMIIKSIGAGLTAASGQNGSVQYSDGSGNLLGNAGLVYDGVSGLLNSTNNNNISFDDGAGNLVISAPGGFINVGSMSFTASILDNALSSGGPSNVLTSGAGAGVLWAAMPASSGVLGSIQTSDGAGNFVGGEDLVYTNGVGITVSGNIIPSTDLVYNLGAVGNSWNNVQSNSATVTNLTTTTVTDSYANVGVSGQLIGCDASGNIRWMQFLGPIAFGNTIIVDSVYGDDLTAPVNGTPYKTVNPAVLAAVSGQHILIMPGTYILTEGIVIPNGVSIRGLSVQTTSLNLTVSTDTVLITMGESNRIEDLTLNLASYGGSCNITGFLFGGTSTMTSKVRTCVLNMTTPNNTDYNNNVYGVNADGTGSLSPSSFSFNCLKGSTINIAASGSGKVRGILVTGTNVMSTRDVNIFIQAPYTGSVGSYVGVETDEISGLGSIQLRSTTVGVVQPNGDSWTASDILQTTPVQISNPTYLASPGIQIGPGVDLVTKTAGGRGFSTWTYPTTLYYGLKGNITSGVAGYLWPGTQQVNAGSFPDSGTPPAYYRCQQPCIISGLSAGLNIASGVGLSVTIEVRYSRNNIVGTVYTSPITVTLSDTEIVANFYNNTVDLNTGDRVHLYVSYTGNNANHAHDLTVQLDMF